MVMARIVMLWIHHVKSVGKNTFCAGIMAGLREHILKIVRKISDRIGEILLDRDFAPTRPRKSGGPEAPEGGKCKEV